MKKVLFLLVMVLSIFSCTQESFSDESSAVGYIRLNVNTITSTFTRSLNSETYKPEQLAVSICNESGVLVLQTDDYTEWQDEDLKLPIGTYTITASSNGFDGQESGFDIPYYVGSTTVTVSANTQKTVNVVCTLATVKVSALFTDRFKAAFSEAVVTFSSSVEGISPLQFVMGAVESRAGYFPVGGLSVKIEAKNDKGSFNMEKTFENVQARDYYALTYDISETGNTQISVKTEDDVRLYSYNINVGNLEQVILRTASQSVIDGDVWSRKATLRGELAGVKEFSAENAYFEYKTVDANEYTRVDVETVSTRGVSDIHSLITQLKDLLPATSYSFRVCYSDGEQTYRSSDLAFVTEEETVLFNGNMDLWYTRPGAGFSRRAQWYACSEEYFTTNGTWWDSSNRGTTEGAGALANKNPTTGDGSTVHTKGGMSAKLASTSAVGVFAAASLYAGSFNSLKGTSGALLDWGRPFISRPKSLHGWLQYAPGTIDFVSTKTPTDAGITKGQTTDLCSAYIALMHVDNPNENGTAITVDNTNMNTFPDWESDPRVVAYAALPDAECVSTEGQWKEFNLELNYHKTDVKPTHIIIVFAASKYGDYFTGSTKTVLYLDDLELVY